MEWLVEFTEEFEIWWNSLSEDEQVAVDMKVSLLQRFGPVLPRPHADVITTSKHANMKELEARWMIANCVCCMRSIHGAPLFF
ncbi:MAG TPA: hypothetical protein VG897_15885 [Terriglobales bacterium]|nr:hypothetical protein [Terriglobales bacterium]